MKKVMPILFAFLSLLAVPTYAVTVQGQLHDSTCATTHLAGCDGQGLTTGGAGQGSYLSEVLSVLYLIAGIVAVLFIIIGGVKYITSTGDPSRIQAAKNTVLYAVLGLIVVILAQYISGYVIKTVAG